MAESFVPVTTSNLSNQTSITNAIDQNFAAVQTALSDVLARGGTSPNTMQSLIDMNSNQIINLPSPGTAQSPVRLQDINSTLTPTPAILSGSNVYTGANSFTATTNFNIVTATTLTAANLNASTFNITTMNAVSENVSTLNVLNQLNVQSGNFGLTSNSLTVNVPAFFKNGPITDVSAWGATGNGSSNDYPAISAAIASVTNTGGVVYFGPGTYLVNTGIVVPASVKLRGSGQFSTVIKCGSDINTVTLSGSWSSLENMSIFGFNSATAGNNAVTITATTVSAIIRDCVMWQGANGLFIQGTDCLIENCFPSGYFSAVQNTGANWFERVKMDSGALGSQQWGLFQGTASASAPQENHFHACDFSGPFGQGAIAVDDVGTGQSVAFFTDSVIGGNVNFINGRYVQFTSCEMPAGSQISYNTTPSMIISCYSLGGSTVYPSTAINIVTQNFNITHT